MTANEEVRPLLRGVYVFVCDFVVYMAPSMYSCVVKQHTATSCHGACILSVVPVFM